MRHENNKSNEFHCFLTLLIYLALPTSLLRSAGPCSFQKLIRDLGRIMIEDPPQNYDITATIFFKFEII
jgi:hypothetical protein